MSDQLLLGIDLGAGSLKATLIDGAGRAVATASAPVETLSPRPGFSEQDPEGWWVALCSAVRQLWSREYDPAAVEAMAITAGAHTHVLEDDAGQVLRPAIMWNDQRSAEQVTTLRQTCGDRILSVSGNQVSATWTLPQLLWVHDNEPDVFRRIRRLRPAKDWLRRRLDGSDATDLTDAWGLMLADAATGQWSEELCSLAHFRTDYLPSIVASTAVTGRVTPQAGRQCGLKPGTTLVCGTSDTNAESFCAGMSPNGIGSLKLATAATVATLTPSPAFSKEVIHYPHLVPGFHYAILGTNSCASAHRWLRDGMFPSVGFEGMEEAAGKVPAGSQGLLFHPYLNGERSPYWDPALRASFIGLGFEHHAGHFARALYEGIAFSLRDCLDVLHKREMGFGTARLVGGGARSALWQQIIADVTGLVIEVPLQADASFGAGLIAGLGIGIFADTADASGSIEVGRRCHPDPEKAEIYDRSFVVYRQAKEALTEVNHRIVAIARDH